MDLLTMMLYGIGLMIIGFFSGLGNVFGQWIFNDYLKERVKKNIDKPKDGFKRIKNSLKRLGEEFG